MFSVRFCHESLTFTAGHFVCYRNVSDGGVVVEEFHSHQFRVWVEVFGPLDEWDMVVDFVTAEQCLRNILRNLEDTIFLPDHSPHLCCKQDGEDVVVTVVSPSAEPLSELRFPAEKIVWIPVTNATTERIAEWLWRKITQEFQVFLNPNLNLNPSLNQKTYEFCVELEESSGCVARVWSEGSFAVLSKDLRR